MRVSNDLNHSTTRPYVLERFQKAKHNFATYIYKDALSSPTVMTIFSINNMMNLALTIVALQERADESNLAPTANGVLVSNKPAILANIIGLMSIIVVITIPRGIGRPCINKPTPLPDPSTSQGQAINHQIIPVDIETIFRNSNTHNELDESSNSSSPGTINQNKMNIFENGLTLALLIGQSLSVGFEFKRLFEPDNYEKEKLFNYQLIATFWNIIVWSTIISTQWINKFSQYYLPDNTNTFDDLSWQERNMVRLETINNGAYAVRMALRIVRIYGTPEWGVAANSLDLGRFALYFYIKHHLKKSNNYDEFINNICWVTHNENSNEIN